VTVVPSTSRAAYHSLPRTDLEEKVLGVIAACGVDGCISDDVRKTFPDLSYSSVTARFSALEEKGQIFRAGDTRPGESGRQQKVMRSIEHAATTPIVLATKKAKTNPFLAGMMYATRIVLKEPDLAAAKLALKKELLKAATK
jgi:hypothetical protein